MMHNYIVDTHCHLDYDVLYNDLDNVVERANIIGIKKLISICVKISQFEKINNIAKKYNNIYCAIGTHPNHADEEMHIEADMILEATKSEKVVAIGETGLDYHYDYADKANQKASFIKHIKVAQASQLPLIIHTRNADGDTLKILAEQIEVKKFPFLLHCYSSGLELASRAIELGGYISFSGIITFKKADDIREIVRQIPKNRVVVETDAPYLAPVPYRSKPNEPSYIIETVKKLSEIWNLPYQETVAITCENSHRLFSKI